MSLTYIDSSIVVALLLKEAPAKKYQRILARKEEIVSSSLLEAELYSTAIREKVPFEKADLLLKGVSLILPNRLLTEELKLIFLKGYCRGADAHHIACALYLDPEMKTLEFFTADHRQAETAEKVGFKVL